MDQGSFLIMDKFSAIVCCLMTDLKQRCHEDKADSIQTFNTPAQSYATSGRTR